ncbi:MAG: histidinol-phosphatase [Enterococcus sp.]
MKFISNAHTHSTFCDGKNSLKEMAQAAIALGFTDLGFTSHSTATFDPGCAGIASEQDYQAAIVNLQEELGRQIKLSVGLELDYFSPTPSVAFDYLIGSVHYFPPRNGEYRSVDESPATFIETLNTWYEGDVLAMASDYYDLVVKHVLKNQPKIVGHFDLFTKFNDELHYLDDCLIDYLAIATNALKKIIPVLRNYDGLVEINTGGISRGWTKAPYPSRYLLDELYENDVPIIITSDSHAVDTLNFHFDQVLELVKEIGFKEVYQLSAGEFKAFPI